MLPPATEKIWNFLKEQPALAGFILAGGSALALTIRHRRSEDLDFFYPEIRLPREQIAALRRSAHQAGFDFQPNDDEASVESFALDGLELHDYQQDFLANGTVKLSFIAPDEPTRRIFSGTGVSKVRVASLAEIFKTKCLVSAVRSKTRDWLDLYVLMRQHGFTIHDYQRVFVETGVPIQCDIGLARLCSGTPQRDDEGFSHLLDKPPSLEEMKSFFVEQRNQLEFDVSTEVARQQLKNGKHGQEQ